MLSEIEPSPLRMDPSQDCQERRRGCRKLKGACPVPGPASLSFHSSKLKHFTILLIFVALLRFADCDASDEMPDFSKISTPPIFVHTANPQKMYFVIESDPEADGSNAVTLKNSNFLCKARGIPNPTYKWERDVGKGWEEFDLDAYPDRISQDYDSGTFSINKLSAIDAGIYRCLASNDNGTAVDDVIDFKPTYLNFFVDSDAEIVDVELGEPFQRECNVPKSNPKPDVYWIKMGVNGDKKFDSINSSHISINDKGTLFFQYVDESDQLAEENYACTSENTVLKDFKFGQYFNINVKKTRRKVVTSVPPQEQFVSSKSLTGTRGEKLNIYCIFSGAPVYNPVWYKDDKKLESNGKFDFDNFGKQLKINNVGEGDAGQYECRFRQNTLLNRKFQVHIDAAPYFPTGAPASKNASEGETVTFVCGAVGKPSPKFTFFKNGKALIADGTRVKIDGPRLSIRNLRRGVNETGDNAVYQCRAQNTHGYIWANFFLNILEFKPVILEGPGEQSVVLNQEVNLTCKVFGVPTPEVTWGGEGFRQGSGFIKQELPMDERGIATLTLQDVPTDVQGSYACSAVNKLGKASASGFVYVRDATKLIDFPTDKTVIAGIELRMPCQASSDPHLKETIEWKIGGEPIVDELITSGRIRIEGDNTLVIPEVRDYDSDTYTCVARTELDSVERSAKLVVKDVPQPPYTAYLGPCMNRTALVKFNYMERSDIPAPVKEFWVQYILDPEERTGDWHTHPVPWTPNESSQTIRDSKRTLTGEVTVALNPWGKYKFRVIARNEIGDSAPKNVSGECETPAAIPEHNPTGVRARGNTPDNLVVYWDPVFRKDWNGPDFRYQVEYKEKGSDEDFESVEVNDPYQDHLVVENLPTYKEYEVRVKSVNKEGGASSIPETIVGYSGEEVPQFIPTGFRLVSDSPSAVSFAWDPVSANQVGGEFKGFKIEHWVSDDTATNAGSGRRKRQTGEKKVAYFDAKATQGTVYGMTPNKENSARMMVYNGAGDGPPTEPIEFNLPEGPPGPVRSLRAYPVASDKIGVVWKTPRQTNGILTAYEIEWCDLERENGRWKVNPNNCPTILIEPPTVTHKRIEALKPESSYRITVRGITGGGRGDPNSVDARTLPVDIPSGVNPLRPDLVDPDIGEDHINVTIQPGNFDQDEPVPIGDQFYVEYKVKGATHWERVDPSEDNPIISLDDLYSGTTYEVVAVSVHTQPDGSVKESKSAPRYYTTMGEPPSSATAAWLIAIIVAIIILIIILIIVCLVVRNRGAKYPVSEKEREQGREPMLGKEEKGFGEYAKPDMDEEKRSLTAESHKSETDSMAEYGEGDAGRFTEDGSFIGQYGSSTSNKVLLAPSGAPKSNVSTFV